MKHLTIAFALICALLATTSWKESLASETGGYALNTQYKGSMVKELQQVK